jgi:molybdopterin-guanine dinucleotide biosynthesis protein B
MWSLKMSALPPILTFAAPSGTGKTTLICAVVRLLTAVGLRVAVLKHDAHRLALDTPGKDTWRYRQAGAWRSLIAGSSEFGLFSAVDGEVSLSGLVDTWLGEADLVLTEGFRRAGHPAIRLHRAGRPADPAWVPPERVVAWASDEQVKTNLPVLPLDDPRAVAAFIVDHLGLGVTLTEGATSTDARPRSPRDTATLASLAATQADADLLVPRLSSFSNLFSRALLVRTAGVVAPPDLPSVIDLRPDAGRLGALLTALARAETPRVLVLGPRHVHAPDALLAGLLRAAAEARADLVTPVAGGHDEPLCAVYGHRCLPALHAALLSGEHRMNAWWGAVHVERVPEATWRAWDPGAAAFPATGM